MHLVGLYVGCKGCESVVHSLITRLTRTFDHWLKGKNCLSADERELRKKKIPGNEVMASSNGKKSERGVAVV